RDGGPARLRERALGGPVGLEGASVEPDRRGVLDAVARRLLGGGDEPAGEQSVGELVHDVLRDTDLQPELGQGGVVELLGPRGAPREGAVEERAELLARAV